METLLLMHELSIVLSIVDIANEQVRKARARKVDSIDLDIGTLAGIEMEALDFAWDAAVNRTVLAKAKRHINHIQARARCLDCGEVFEIQQLFDACPRCGNLFSELLRGKELRVRALTVS